MAQPQERFPKNETSHKRTYAARLGARGRLVLPAELRAQLGLQEGDELLLSVESDGTFKGESRRNLVHRLRGLFKDLAPPGRSLVDELIAERREEARREELGL